MSSSEKIMKHFFQKGTGENGEDLNIHIGSDAKYIDYTPKGADKSKTLQEALDDMETSYATTERAGRVKVDKNANEGEAPVALTKEGHERLNLADDVSVSNSEDGDLSSDIPFVSLEANNEIEYATADTDTLGNGTRLGKGQSFSGIRYNSLIDDSNISSTNQDNEKAKHVTLRTLFEIIKQKLAPKRHAEPAIIYRVDAESTEPGFFEYINSDESIYGLANYTNAGHVVIADINGNFDSSWRQDSSNPDYGGSPHVVPSAISVENYVNQEIKEYDEEEQNRRRAYFKSMNIPQGVKSGDEWEELIPSALDYNENKIYTRNYILEKHNDNSVSFYEKVPVTNQPLDITPDALEYSLPVPLSSTGVCVNKGIEWNQKAAVLQEYTKNIPARIYEGVRTFDFIQDSRENSKINLIIATLDGYEAIDSVSSNSSGETITKKKFTNHLIYKAYLQFGEDTAIWSPWTLISSTALN